MLFAGIIISNKKKKGERAFVLHVYLDVLLIIKRESKLCDISASVFALVNTLANERHNYVIKLSFNIFT